MLHTGASLHSSPSKAPATPAQAASAIPPASPTTPPGTAVADGGVTNESLAWALLYDLNFQLPTADAEAIWSNATGETRAMEEPVPALEGLSPAQAAAITSLRVRRIADQAFWDSVAGAQCQDYHPLSVFWSSRPLLRQLIENILY